MRFTILIILIITAVSVFGQNHFIGLTGGLNFTNANTGNFLSNKDNRHGYVAGLSYEYRINEKNNLGVDLLYSQQGFTSNIIITDDLGNPIGEEEAGSFNYDYLSFPVKYGFHVGDKIYGFVNFGLVPSLLIEAKTIEPAIEGFVEDVSTDVTDKVNDFDFAGLIEIGGSFRINERIEMVSSFIYKQSFITITNNNYFKDASIRHYGMNLSFGLKYALII